MINDESSFTLIPSLLGGLAATLISATILFKKYRKHKDQEMIVD
jgi:putative membrane protein